MTYHTYTKNDSYFDQINTEEKAYFLGLLLTDGCNYEKEGQIKIDLVESDSYILEKLMKCIEYDGKIAHYPSETKIINGKLCVCQPSCRLVFLSKHMSKVLASYGMVSHKSENGLFIKKDIIPNELYNHFVRGMIDGDGGISYWIDNQNTCHKKFQINFCSTADSVQQLAKYFETKFNCKPCIQDRYPDRDNNNLQFNILGNNVVRRIADWLYKEATVYLIRKYEKYKELIQENERVANDKKLYGSMKSRRCVKYLPTGVIYESLAEAERATGISRSNICVQAKKCNGRWAYCDEVLTNTIR